MCLCGSAKCWYLTLSDIIKKDFERLSEEFNQDYLQNKQWLNTTRLEITKPRIGRTIYFRHVRFSSSCRYRREDLSKTLILGLPAKRRWHVVSFNPTTLSETIQRILLGEATLLFNDNEHINVVSENWMVTTVQIMDERIDKLEDLLKSC